MTPRRITRPKQICAQREMFDESVAATVRPL